MHTTRATHSSLIQGVDDLAENAERFVDGRGLLQSGCVVASQTAVDAGELDAAEPVLSHKHKPCCSQSQRGRPN